MAAPCHVHSSWFWPKSVEGNNTTLSLQYNVRTIVHFTALTFPQKRYLHGTNLCLLPTTSFQRNSVWSSLRKMVIRTTIIKEVNKQAQNMKNTGELSHKHWKGSEWPESADLEWQINRGYPHLVNWQGVCFLDDFELRNQQKNPDHDSVDKNASILYILLFFIFSVLLFNISSWCLNGNWTMLKDVQQIKSSVFCSNCLFTHEASQSLTNTLNSIIYTTRLLDILKT